MAPRELGQHLLCDDAVIARVVQAAGLVPGDQVLDAGAGMGALTIPIAEAIAPGGHVWAVDVDPIMVDALHRHRLPDASIVAGDLLTWPLPAGLTAVVANPPYKIAAPLIERLAAAGVPRAVYVVPRELAERLTAAPGSQHYGKLTVRVALHAVVEDLGFIPRKAFDPPPAVTSSIIRLHARNHVPTCDPQMLDAVLEAAWAAWHRNARRAFASLATELRLDRGALSRLLADEGWADLRTNQLQPDAFAAIARHLAGGQEDRT